ncbi:hypothetical protein R1sor_004377 [Riccia sorocarpa]|uniref:Uncharacterized protein n=1 Tax=Riccia sorocarpa TaxID=122646 RepID=A0ABD3HIQ1_9MARC
MKTPPSTMGALRYPPSTRACRSYGDDRYFGEALHEAIKALWPDEVVTAPSTSQQWVGTKKRTRAESQPALSTKLVEFTLPGPDSAPTTFRVEASCKITVLQSPPCTLASDYSRFIATRPHIVIAKTEQEERPASANSTIESILARASDRLHASRPES